MGGEYLGSLHPAKDIPHGLGRWIPKENNGGSYLGNWVNGVFQDQGEHLLYTGEKYVGSFRNFKYHGFGTLYDRNGNVIKKGRWDNGKYVGP